MTNEQVKAYMEFMHNKDNECKCANCPANEGCKGNNQLPCGQYNCWVTVHCK